MTKATLKPATFQWITNADIDAALAFIKRAMGFNILEMAAILQVSRPTFYEWIESKKIAIQQKNQKRLNSIYEIAKLWREKNIGQLSGNLYKPIGVTNLSLFDLLKSNTLNLHAIKSYLENIAQLILTKHQKDKLHEEVLKKYGFEPASKEDREDRLVDVDLL